MDTFTTYNLFSKSSGKYYVGHTNNISRRFEEHNSGQNISTKSGAPWDLVFTQPFASNSDACALESKIKKRGIKRFLSGNNFPG